MASYKHKEADMKREKPPEKVATGLAVVALILQIVDKLLDIALKLVRN